MESAANLKLPRLAVRAEDSHKGSYGSGLLIGGSRGMSGAIALAGLAAAHAGAGLVRMAVPDGCLETVASFSPCPMSIGLPEDSKGRMKSAAAKVLCDWLPKANCVAIGPGMGVSEELQALLSNLISSVHCPLVVDADGLNNLAFISDWPHLLVRKAWVMTPHPGEWSRLSGVAASDREGQERAAIEFAKRHAGVVVLKGYHTLITDGEVSVRNLIGTPAMATGGSGDVLTGVITSLICQGMSSRDAAHLGVCAHGYAAVLAEESLRSHVVLPTELIRFLGRGLAECPSDGFEFLPSRS